MKKLLLVLPDDLEQELEDRCKFADDSYTHIIRRALRYYFDEFRIIKVVKKESEEVSNG